MIETIVIRNIKRDHSDKPTVVLSETEFEKEESYQCDENKPGIWAYELGNGVNSLTEPNFCIVYCYSILLMMKSSSLFSPSTGIGLGHRRKWIQGVSEPVHCRSGVLVQGGSGPCSIEEERDLD